MFDDCFYFFCVVLGCSFCRIFVFLRYVVCGVIFVCFGVLFSCVFEIIFDVSDEIFMCLRL